jgi:hypothetical protein
VFHEIGVRGPIHRGVAVNTAEPLRAALVPSNRSRRVDRRGDSLGCGAPPAQVGVVHRAQRVARHGRPGMPQWRVELADWGSQAAIGWPSPQALADIVEHSASSDDRAGRTGDRAPAAHRV